jgi:hypothetical protein
MKQFVQKEIVLECSDMFYEPEMLPYDQEELEL